MCADYTYDWGQRRNYNQECPKTENMTDIFVEEQDDIQECAEYDEDNPNECIKPIAHGGDEGWVRLTLMDCPGTIDREGKYPSGPGTDAPNARRPQHNESWIFGSARAARSAGGACFKAMVPGDLTATPPIFPQDRSDLFPYTLCIPLLEREEVQGPVLLLPGLRGASRPPGLIRRRRHGQLSKGTTLGRRAKTLGQGGRASRERRLSGGLGRVFGRRRLHF